MNKKNNESKVVISRTFSEKTYPKNYYKKCEAFDLKAIGRRLTSIREGMGLTINEMAETLFLSYSGLKKLEEGNSFIGASVLILLHERYGVDLLWLLLGRHTTHDDVCLGLMHLNREELFDIFVRLFSYFQGGDEAALNPLNGKLSGIKDFAKWDNTFYRLMTQEEAQEAEVPYEDWNVTKQEIEKNLIDMDPESRKSVLSFIESMKNQQI